MILAGVLKYIQDNPDQFKGEQGEIGPPGTIPPLDYDEITEEVLPRLPPIYPQWVDENGDLIDSISGGVRLGQTLPLRLELILRDLKGQKDARSRSQ